MKDLYDLNNGITANTNGEKNIIELTDIVENGIDIKFDKDDKIIELTNLVKDDESFDDIADPDLFSPDSDLNEEPDFDDELDFSEDYDFDDADHSDHKPLQLDHDTSVTDVSLTAEQFESALEKVIEKKFSEKIETLLFRIVEKIVEKEIADIKNKLTEKITKINKT